MKPSHDSLDELLIASLHGELTPEERAALEARLRTDPAARAAYLEIQHMHDLLEKTHREARPDPAFEERMISGVRRKIQHEGHRETAWESLVVLGRGLKGLFGKRSRLFGSNWSYVGACGVILVVIMLGVIKPPVTGALKHAQRAHAVGQDMLTRAGFAPAVSSAMNSPSVAMSSSGQAGMGISPSSRPAPSMAGALAAAPAAPIPSPQDYLPKSRAGVDASADGYSAAAPFVTTQNGNAKPVDKVEIFSSTAISNPTPDRKLIRNARLDLEVKSFQKSVDDLAALVKTAGGYVETSSSERGGNGKLQGTVVVKVLPQNLDSFLLKLRDLGEIKNQSVGTEDVTKAYYDTQARLDNSRRMEAQLQELLKRDNGKVSELLQVERELGRVRGQIEQMQGELKLYDFQVRYATVTLSLREKDLDQAAAYLLKERDEFSLFSGDVEGTFQQAKKAADDFQAHILNASSTVKRAALSPLCSSLRFRPRRSSRSWPGSARWDAWPTSRARPSGSPATAARPTGPPTRPGPSRTGCWSILPSIPTMRRPGSRRS